MSNNPIRVGIIGAGRNTRTKHIPGLRAQPGVEIVGVCNRSLESSQRAAAELDIPQTYTHWQEMIADPKLDAIVIGTWPYLHERVSVAALAAGKHVMCEARMAMNGSEARRMWAASQARPELVAQIVPSPMTLRVDRTLQKHIREGYLGEILAVDIQAGGDFLDADAPLHWRQDVDLSGSNIMSMGIWYEALMRWVGTADRVMALGQTFVKMRADEHGKMKAVRVPDHVDVIGEMVCGAQLHMQISTVAGLAGAPHATLYGSRGTLRFTQNRLYGGQPGDSDLREIEIPTELQGGWRVEEEFVNAMRGKETITHTAFADGVKYMDFTDAVQQSLAIGAAVVLPI